MKFGDNLRKLRKLKKLSQEELADRMHVSRQSVSKWETGDSYPEMNHILELCKIFHCHINDLVNDRMLDVDSLDEEVKMNVVKFKKEQQNKMKILSKMIALIAKICRIAVMVAIPIVVVSMIILGIFIQKVDVLDGEIKFDGNDIISVTSDDDKISLEVNGILVGDISKNEEFMRMEDILESHSKGMIFVYVEVGFAFLVMSLIFVMMMLKSLENLFGNIHRGDTPFTLENVNYIRKIAYLMIVVTILPNVMGVIFEVILKMDLDIGFELFSLIEILFLFSIAYIFQYGYEIQLDSKGRMYGADE